jgi:hypothetical protein
MENIEKLMYDFQEKGHPLGKGISENEIPNLVTSLMQRLTIADDILGMEPKNLNILANLLLKYYQTKTETGYIFSNEEIAQIVREIAAYIGKVIMAHTNGVWISDADHFSYTRIDIDMQTIGREGGNTKYNINRTIFLLNPASNTWSAIQKGIEPKILNVYRAAVSKEIREKLK